METLLDQVTRAAGHHPSPALPLDELQRLVGSGVRVREDDLLRSLASATDRVRVVDPWRGPWAGLRDPRRPRSLGPPWVVTRPGLNGQSWTDDRPALRRLRASVAHLGWVVDEGSATAMARWCLLVYEAGKVRDRARRATA